MDDLLRQIPKPLLVVGILLGAILLIMLLNPPHSVCDTQIGVVKSQLQGVLYAEKSGKITLPAPLKSAKEACRLGNSAGACYEYFAILRKTTAAVTSVFGECLTEVFSIKEIQTTIEDGVEIMARLAWGEFPPEKGVEKLGWFKESEMVTYCRIRNMYIRAKSEESWYALARHIYPHFPGVPKRDAAGAVVEETKAIKTLSEMEIWSRSLFSIRCEQYL